MNLLGGGGLTNSLEQREKDLLNEALQAKAELEATNASLQERVLELETELLHGEQKVSNLWRSHGDTQLAGIHQLIEMKSDRESMTAILKLDPAARASRWRMACARTALALMGVVVLFGAAAAVILLVRFYATVAFWLLAAVAFGGVGVGVLLLAIAFSCQLALQRQQSDRLLRGVEAGLGDPDGFGSFALVNGLITEATERRLRNRHTGM